MLLLEALENIRDKGPANRLCGICANVRDLLKGEYTNLQITNRQKELFVKWPKFSGDLSFPIEGGEAAYDNAKWEGTLWKEDTEYGRLRKELLLFMINELRKN